MQDTKRLTVAQIKPGDVLARENDHIGRPDDRITVVSIKSRNPRVFNLTGYFRADEYVKALSAQNYSRVYRNGELIGTWFVKYW